MTDENEKQTTNEFNDDPTLPWAEEIVADRSLEQEQSYAHFVELKQRYQSLLKQFAKVVRISDGYQRSLKEANLRLSTAASTDYLTGLSNRRRILDQIDAELSRSRRHDSPFCIVLADIDGFKGVNDSYGHEAGDRVLVFVADSMRSSVRREDLCSRWGGEEFLICLPQATLAQAVHVAEKLRTEIADATVKYQQMDIRITVSLGVAEYRPGSRIDELIREADIAMIGAKRTGKNRTCSFPDLS